MRRRSPTLYSKYPLHPDHRHLVLTVRSIRGAFFESVALVTDHANVVPVEEDLVKLGT